MWVYLWTEKTETVQTFDFQNDWDLGWTGVTIYGTPTYVSWEWWTIWGNSSYQSNITPPNSVYNWETLVKWKIWFYKTDNWTSLRTSWCWFGTAGFTNWATLWTQNGSGWPEANVYDGSSDHRTQTSYATWEVTLEYTFNDDWHIWLSINWWTEYNLWNFATQFRNRWLANDLWLCIWRWDISSAPYIRKLEITTK